MNIQIEDNKIILDNYSCRTESISYSVSTNKDSITFYHNGKNLSTAIVSETTINGEQVSAENIDTLLAPLFESKNLAEGSNPATEASPYSKVDYTNPLAFPSPIRTGHIVDFMRDNAVYKSYQWNGQSWEMMSSKPNLVYSIVEPYGSIDHTGDPAVLSSKKIDGKYYLTILDDTTLKNSVITDNLEVVDNTYKIADMTMYLQKDQPKYCIEDLSIDSLRFEVLNVGSEASPNSIYVKNLETSSISSAFLDLISLEGIKKSRNMDILANISIMANSLTVKDSELGSIFSRICLDSTKTLSPAIEVVNNNFIPSGHIVISSEYNLDNIALSGRSINISKNKGVNSITVELGALGIVESAIFDFDETCLQSISFSGGAFSQAALDTLVEALTSKVYTQENRSFNFAGLPDTETLLPSEEQKTKLINAGWTVYFS